MLLESLGREDVLKWLALNRSTLLHEEAQKLIFNKFPDEEMRAMLALHRPLSEDSFQALLGNQTAWILDHLSENISLNKRQLLQVLNVSTTDRQLSTLIRQAGEDEDFRLKVRDRAQKVLDENRWRDWSLNVARFNSNLTGEEFNFIYNKLHEVDKNFVLNGRSVSTEVKETIFKHGTDRQLEEIAASENLNLEDFQTLIAFDREKIIDRLIANPSLPESLFEKLISPYLLQPENSIPALVSSVRENLKLFNERHFKQILSNLTDKKNPSSFLFHYVEHQDHMSPKLLESILNQEYGPELAVVAASRKEVNLEKFIEVLSRPVETPRNFMAERILLNKKLSVEKVAAMSKMSKDWDVTMHMDRYDKTFAWFHVWYMVGRRFDPNAESIRKYIDENFDQSGKAFLEVMRESLFHSMS